MCSCWPAGQSSTPTSPRQGTRDEQGQFCGKSHADDPLPASIFTVLRRLRGSEPMSDTVTAARANSITVPCAGARDSLQPVREMFLAERIGSLGWRCDEGCGALADVADC